MSVTLSELIDTINEDPVAVREALALIKRTIGDLPAFTELSETDAWAARDASDGVDKRLTLAVLQAAILIGDTQVTLDEPIPRALDAENVSEALLALSRLSEGIDPYKFTLVDGCLAFEEI